MVTSSPAVFLLVVFLPLSRGSSHTVAVSLNIWHLHTVIAGNLCTLNRHDGHPGLFLRRFFQTNSQRARRVRLSLLRHCLESRRAVDDSSGLVAPLPAFHASLHWLVACLPGRLSRQLSGQWRGPSSRESVWIAPGDAQLSRTRRSLSSTETIVHEVPTLKMSTSTWIGLTSMRSQGVFLPTPSLFFRGLNRKQPCGVTSCLVCNWRALSLV